MKKINMCSMGYLDAYEYLENLNKFLLDKGNITSSIHKNLKEVLRNFQHTIEKAQQMEKIDEGFELIKEAVKEGVFREKL